MIRASEYTVDRSDSPDDHLLVDGLLFEDVVGWNLSYAIDVVVEESSGGPGQEGGGTQGEAVVSNRFSRIEFRNVTADCCLERSVRWVAPWHTKTSHVVLQVWQPGQVAHYVVFHFCSP